MKNFKLFISLILSFLIAQTPSFAANSAINFGVVGGLSGATTADYGIYLENPTGYGSTNTKIRTFGKIVKNTAANYITLTQSAANGDSFTAQVSGLFAVCYGDWRSTSDMSVAITVNDSVMTTNGRSAPTWTQGIRALYAGVSANDYANACDVMNLSINDVVRAHSDGNNAATDQIGYFYIYYLGSQSPSSLFLEGGNGYGSTNTLIRRWLTTRENTGSAFTVTDSSTLGMTVTVNENGMYWMCRAESNATNSTSLLGVVTVNDATLTSTTPYSYTWAQGQRLTHANAAAYYTANNVVCGFFKFANGDVIRGHDYSSGLANGTNSFVYFRMIKISGTSKVANAGTVSGFGSVNTKIRNFTVADYFDPTSISISPSARTGTAFIAMQSGVFGGCHNEYATSAPSAGIVFQPKLPTTVMTTPLSYGEGFRGFRYFQAGSSTYGHCAFNFMNAGDQMFEQSDGTSGTDSFIRMSGAKVN